MSLYYSNTNPNDLVGYSDAGYLLDPDDSKSHTGYVFLQGGIAVSWKSTKQTLTTTSSNHAEVIALYEACREYVWLRQLLNHIHTSAGQPHLTSPITIFEDNHPWSTRLPRDSLKAIKLNISRPNVFTQLNNTATTSTSHGSLPKTIELTCSRSHYLGFCITNTTLELACVNFPICTIKHSDYTLSLQIARSQP